MRDSATAKYVRQLFCIIINVRTQTKLTPKFAVEMQPMKPQKLPLYTSQQTRELDQLAIESGISGYQLMKKAGTSAFHFILSRWPDSHKIVIVCGVGNNGGDGYVIARLAKMRGMDLRLIQLGDLSKQSDDSSTARHDLYEEGVKVEFFDNQDFSDADLIIDALLGTGIQRDVHGNWKKVIDAINRAPAKVASIDIPSGLNADSGYIQGVAVKADITVTFIGRKQGMYTANGCDQSGDITFDSLNIADEFYKEVTPASYLLQTFSPNLNVRRAKNSHKGLFGNIVIIGGAPGMNGAALLAAEAALRAGCGLVTVLTHPDHSAFLNLNRPEIMCHGVENGTALVAHLHGADVVVIGPGLGTDTWGKELLHKVIMETASKNIPVVIDADGLNNLASEKHTMRSLHFNWVLTPHPGEAARLLECTTAQVQQDRFLAARQISNKYNAMCVLKGAGSVIRSADTTTVCPYGNPGMASAGMGDILSGILGTMLAQALKEDGMTRIEAETEAVHNAVMLHALAGDAAARKQGEKGMIASDLFPEIRHILNANTLA